jgi:hypothetical protein
MELRVILSEALEDYKNNPVIVVPRVIEYLADGIILMSIGLFWVAVFGYSSLFTLTGFSFKTTALIFISLSFAGLMVMMVTAMARAAVVAMSLEVIKGNRASMEHAVQGIKASAHKIFLYFVFLLAAVALVVVIAAMAMRASPSLLFLVMPLGMVAFFSLYLFTFLTPQQIVVRGCGVSEGITESAAFVINNYGKVLGYGFVVLALILSAWLIPASIFFIINELTRYHPFLNLAAGIFHSLLSLAIGIAVSPYLEIVKTYMVVGEIHGRTGENKKEETERDAGESQTSDTSE